MSVKYYFSRNTRLLMKSTLLFYRFSFTHLCPLTVLFFFRWSMNEGCNLMCSCPPTVQYNPLCSQDGSVLFYSPCHAGCEQGSLNQTLQVPIVMFNCGNKPVVKLFLISKFYQSCPIYLREQALSGLLL